MKSPAESFRYRPLAVNRTFHHMTMIFMSAGALMSLLYDSRLGIPGIIVMDILVIAAFGASFFLVARRIVDHGLVLLCCFILSIVAYYVSFFVIWPRNPSGGNIWDDMGVNFLLSGILGACSSLMLARWGAWFFLGMGLLYTIFLGFLPQVSSEYGRILFMGLVLSFLLGVAWYFRKSLENLVSESEAIIRVTRNLKDQKEKENEDNRPFVYFGQNSVGLVMDFRVDVSRMQEHLLTLRRAGGDPELQVSLLQHMEDQARSLSRRIDLVNFITSSGPERPPEALMLSQVLESALYPFRINPLLKEWLTVEHEVPLDLETFDRRYCWLRAIEFLMRQTLNPSLGVREPMRIRLLVTGNRDEIRVAYQESRPVFLASDPSLRKLFQVRPLDQLRQIVSERLEGTVLVPHDGPDTLVLTIPRRSVP